MKRATWTFALSLMIAMTFCVETQAANVGVNIVGTWELYGTGKTMVFNKDGSCGGDFSGYSWYMQSFSSDPPMPHWLLIFKGTLNNGAPTSTIVITEEILWGMVDPKQPNQINGDWVELETSAEKGTQSDQPLEPMWTEKSGTFGWSLIRQK